MGGERKTITIRLHNIKARFQVDAPVRGFAQILGKPRPVNNFTVHRKLGSDKVVFTVFDNSRWINVTGVCHFDRLATEAESFCREFSLSLTPDSIRVDSTTATGVLPNVDRSLLSRLAIEYRRDQHRCPFAIGVRTYNFPSLHFRQRKKFASQGGGVSESEERVRPSFTLFTTGKFVILGAKSSGQIVEAFNGVIDWLLTQGWLARDLTTNTASLVAQHMDHLLDLSESEPALPDRYTVERRYLAKMREVKAIVEEVEREEAEETPFSSLTPKPLDVLPPGVSPPPTAPPPPLCVFSGAIPSDGEHLPGQTKTTTTSRSAPSSASTD